MARRSEVYVRALSAEEQQMLQQLYHRTPDAITKTRCHILLLSAQHYSVPQIAALIFFSEDTAARCIHDFNQTGLDAILHEKGGGRPPKVTPDYLNELFLAVESDPRELECPYSVWTAGLLAQYLAECTGMTLDESRIRSYLHTHGYGLSRPVLTVSSPDPAYEDKKARIKALQQQAQRGEIELYYEDEVDLARLSGIVRCWCKQGQQSKIETPRKNEKRYGAGLINWVTGKLYWAMSDHKDHALFRAVLSQVVPPEPSLDPAVKPVKKYIVIDNYRIHFAKPVQAFLAAHPDEVELVCLPTYSPKLNPVERFWKHLRRRVTHNHFFQTIDRLVQAVNNFFREIVALPEVVRSVAGLAA